MKNKENDPVDQINEQEYQKSLKETEKKSKSNRGNVESTGVTDGQGNFIEAQNGVLTEAQEDMIKDGNWSKYSKYSDGSYDIASPKKSAKDSEEEENGNGKSKKK